MTGNNIPKPTIGYCEGYYGQLLSWDARSRLLDKLQQLEMNTYVYAPKEDYYHRVGWREPYPQDWSRCFSEFCKRASTSGINVVAGVAPGIDFDFSHLSADRNEGNSGSDFSILLQKSRQLLSLGASSLMLLIDDIDPDFERRKGHFRTEGEAHAALANRLADALPGTISVVPRIYANELSVDAVDYLPSFTETLHPAIEIYYCGKTIVAAEPHPADIEELVGPVANGIVIWDNLYANDYCPRRLFTGAWQGRQDCPDLVLNPTGMIETDLLLLDLMKIATNDLSADARRKVFRQHGVPAEFELVEQFYNSPHFTDQALPPAPTADDPVFAALETLLWRWKSPLSREWYPLLFGLKQDLMLAQGLMPCERVYKTQTAALASVLEPTLAPALIK